MKILGKDYLLVTLDFETFYATGYSLSALNTFAYVAADQFSIHGVGLKIEDEPTRWFNDTETALAWIDAKNTGSLPIALLCQNTYFDGWILHHHYDWHPDLYLDTMCMSRGLFPASSASLEKLCERLWPNDPKMRKGKELVQFKGTTTEQLYANQAALKTMVGYCIQDVELTYAAFIRMEPYYPDSELRLIDLTLRMMCEPLLRIDVPRVEDCLANAVAHRTKQIENSGYAESTLSSNAQFEALIRKLDLPVPLKDSPTAKEPDGVTPKKIAALGKADLGFQELRRNHPQFEHIWQGRIAAKSVGEITRAERFLDTARQCDGYMPVPLVYYSAHTGRYGGGEKLNLQNLGRTSELRRALCAQPGQMVYVADSSNIEARMLAWEAGQEDLLEIFRTGGDVYAYTAQDIYNRPIDKKKDPHERFIGKVTCLGADTRVITHRGIKRLVDVTTADQLWDGSQWVNHDGLMYKGEKPTISICGVDMTPDHKTLCGTTWHEAETLARDASTLFRALETGAGALQSLATWSGNVGACEPSSCDATVLHPSTPSTRATTPGSRQPAATSVQSLPPASSDTGPTATQCPTMATEPDYSTDSQPQSAGAITHATRCSSPTDYGAFTSTNPGETTAPVSLPTSRPSPDGTNPTWKWIELMLTGGMNLETSVSSPEPRTHATNAGSATSKPESGNSKPESDSSKSRMPVYDLLNAGPNHRFTILTDAGPMIVHNCLGLGYGMGWRKFQDTLAAGALGGPPVFMAEHEVQHIVNTFRTKRWAIKNYWQQADQAIVDMYMGNTRQWGPLTIHRNCIVMPNGMALQYPGLRPAEDDEFGGWEYHNGQFHTKIYGGKLAENITQALARIVLFDQMLAVEELFAPYGGRVVMNVHDEIIAVGPDLGVPEDQNELFQQMLDIMRTPPKWCPDLPLDGEGGVAAEYSK